MDELVRSVLDSRLNLPVSRRRLIQGAAGLATLTVLGAPGGAALADGKLGGALNFLGYDGEQGANVGKTFLDKNGIKLNATFVSAAFMSAAHPTRLQSRQTIRNDVPRFVLRMAVPSTCFRGARYGHWRETGI